MTRTVKIWTTVDKGLKEELKALSRDLGFRNETDCLREAIRLGTQNLMAQRSMSTNLRKRKDAMAQVSSLLSDEYERMKPKELELKMRAQWH